MNGNKDMATQTTEITKDKPVVTSSAAIQVDLGKSDAEPDVPSNHIYGIFKCDLAD